MTATLICRPDLVAASDSLEDEGDCLPSYYAPAVVTAADLDAFQEYEDKLEY